MAGKKLELGATGETVAKNITRLRESAGLNYTQVSERLAAAGRSINPVGVRRIEDEERRVDADDLVALAVALGVSPVTLLLPSEVAADDTVTVCNAEFKAGALWEWLIAEWPFPGRPGLAEFFARALPPWKLAEVERRIARRHQMVSLPDGRVVDRSEVYSDGDD